MLEKVIEDWLTSVSEKHFEVPFAQLLSLQGYSVLHIAKPHGPMEQGKDILARAPDGMPCAFQMKSGDLTLTQWRDSLKGQVEDLLDTAIQHPGIGWTTPHRAFLVTTGRLDDTLRQTIDSFNRAREQAGKHILTVWVKGDLLKMTGSALQRFMPCQIPELRDFLRLAIVEGKAMPDKKELARFFREVASSGTAGVSVATKTAAELVLLGAHLVGPYQREENHVAEIEVWGLVVGQLMYLASQSSATRHAVAGSLALVETAIFQSMARLCAEVAARKTFVEGNGLADPYVYRTRMTYTIGFLACAVLYGRWLGKPLRDEGAALAFMRAHTRELFLWGEGAVPYLLAAGWALDTQGAPVSLEALACVMTQALGQSNRPIRQRATSTPSLGETERRRGLPDPYVSVEDALLKPLQATTSPFEPQYIGTSYSLEPLVFLLAKRMRRQFIQQVWSDVTRISLAIFRPDSPRDLWQWHNDTGTAEQRYVANPTSWRDLRKAALNPESGLIPPLSESYPHLLLVYTLVAPHRLNRSTTVMLDRVNWHLGPEFA